MKRDRTLPTQGMGKWGYGRKVWYLAGWRAQPIRRDPLLPVKFCTQASVPSPRLAAQVVATPGG